MELVAFAYKIQRIVRVPKPGLKDLQESFLLVSTFDREVESSGHFLDKCSASVLGMEPCVILSV